MPSEPSHTAVLGLGAMGSRMAKRLLAAGHRVTAWSRSGAGADELLALGATVAATPRAAAQDADHVVCMVRDNEASASVWCADGHGALLGLRADAVAIESSTLTPTWTRELASRCAARGVAFLEAPVAGSRPQADAGQLIYFAGGDAQVLARAEPVLKTMGSTVHHTGPAGSAAVVKLIVNAMLGIQVAAWAEALGLARQAGMDASRVLEILGTTPVASPAAKAAGAAMLAGSFAPLFPIDLVAKDFAYALQTAQAVSADMPMTQGAHDVLQAAIGRGLHASNITALATLYLRSNA